MSFRSIREFQRVPADVITEALNQLVRDVNSQADTLRAEAGRIYATRQDLINDEVPAAVTCVLVSRFSAGLPLLPTYYVAQASAPAINALRFVQSQDERYWVATSDVAYPEMFGAGAGVATDDTAAFAACVETEQVIMLGPRRYYYNSTTPISTRKGILGTGGVNVTGHIGQSQILCQVACDTVVQIIGEKSFCYDFAIHGGGHVTANSAKHGITFVNANGCRAENVTVEYCRQDGFYVDPTASGNKNSIDLSTCRARYNGTIVVVNSTRNYPAGGAVYRPANTDNAATATAGDSSFVLTYDWVAPAGFEFDANNTVVWIGSDLHRVTAISGTTMSVSPNVKTTVSGQGFSLHQGSGFCIPYAADDNAINSYNCFAYGNAFAGYWDQSVSPGGMFGGTSEWNGVVGIAIGKPGGAASYNFKAIGVYSEQNVREYWVANSLDALIQKPNASQSTVSRTDALGNISQRGWWQLVLIEAGSNVVDFPFCAMEDTIETTNSSSVSALSRRTILRQGGGVHCDFVLPDTPRNAAYPEEYLLDLSDTSNAVITVKSAAPVNGLAGATGVSFIGGYRHARCSWSKATSSWVVAADGQDYAPAAPTVGLWPAGRIIFNSATLPASGIPMGWISTGAALLPLANVP